MWNRHDLIFCMNGRDNNLVLDNFLNCDILYGMLKTYWKPLVHYPYTNVTGMTHTMHRYAK